MDARPLTLADDCRCRDADSFERDGDDFFALPDVPPLTAADFRPSWQDVAEANEEATRWRRLWRDECHRHQETAERLTDRRPFGFRLLIAAAGLLYLAFTAGTLIGYAIGTH